MIGSGIFVAIQFATFSLVGALLWSYNCGRSAEQLGVGSTDNLYPNFILHSLPVVISGLMVAGILGAATGSLSSALNSMSNSTVSDIIRSFSSRTPSDGTMLIPARVMTLVYVVRVVKINATTAGATTPTAIAAQWLVPIGVIVTLIVGGVMSLFHPPEEVRQMPVSIEPDPESATARS